MWNCWLLHRKTLNKLHLRLYVCIITKFCQHPTSVKPNHEQTRQKQQKSCYAKTHNGRPIYLVAPM